MPIIKSAIKKMRQDQKRTKQNRSRKVAVKALVKTVTENPSAENLSKAFSALDKAAKKGLVHKKSAGRKKAALSKLLKQKVKAVKPKNKINKKEKLSKGRL